MLWLSELEKKEEKYIKDKSLVLQSHQSLGEGNFFDLPFIYPFRTKEILTFYEFKWLDSVNKKNRSIRVYGNDKLGGIPTSFDYDVLIALYKIMVKNNQNSFAYNKDSSKYEFDGKVEFSFPELAEALGWKTENSKIGGNNIKKLKESLERLASITIFNTELGGLYDITKKNSAVDTVTQINLIQSLKYYDPQNPGEVASKKSSCRIGEFFLNSLQNSYLKIIDYDFYLEISSWYTKKLYVLLNKWRGEKAQIDLLFDTIYQRLPLPEEKETKERNRIIKKAANELVSLGFLTSFVINPKAKKIQFYFNQDFKKTSLSLNEPKKMGKYEYITQAREKYRKREEIVNRLKSVGFDNEYINMKLDMCSASRDYWEYLKALLRYTDCKEYFNAIKDIKAFLETGMYGENYDIEPAFYDNYKGLG